MNPTLHAATLPRRRPEVELLLCCARTRMEPEKTERVRQLLKEEIDWSYLSQTAFHHGILPLLSWNLNSLHSDDIPQVLLNHLNDAFRVIAQWNLYLTGELLRLLKLFQDAEIRALPFKGPVLAVVAYGNPLLRHFGDLDILMPREDILKAKDILVSQGYHAKLDLTASEEAAYLRSHHDYAFIRANDGVVVEIQWGITQWSFAFPIAFEDVWARHEEVCFVGVRVRNLSLEDSLLILCVHGAKHRWEQLRWICDIAELINTHQERIDWERLLKQSRALGGERMLLLGLYLAQNLLGARLPEDLMKKIESDYSSVKSLTHQVIGRLFRDRANINLLLEIKEGPFFLWSVRERWRDKLAIAWRYFPEYFPRLIVPNENDEAFLKLPPSLSLGYYLVHPVRLVKEFWSEFRGRATNAGK
jgi:hypothetical protein